MTRYWKYYDTKNTCLAGCKWANTETVQVTKDLLDNATSACMHILLMPHLVQNFLVPLMVVLFVALQQDYYSWRHDTVLMKLVKGLKQLLPPAYNLYSDLDGSQASYNQRYSKRGKKWEICKNRMDQCTLKGYDVTFRHVYKSQCTSKQVSKWQNVSNSCAWTDLCARDAEEHDSYQQRFNHRQKSVHATVHLLLQEPFLTLRFLIICVWMCSQLWYLQKSFNALPPLLKQKTYHNRA